MKITPKKIVKHTKAIVRKSQRRSFSNFYKGQSLPRVIYKGGRFMITRGPGTTLRVLKRELLKDSTTRFPNGLVSTVEMAHIKAWYKSYGKPVSIVIPSYNDVPLVKECVESIAATVRPEMYQVIIVDDYCQPENRKKLKALESKNVEILYREKNGGFAKAVNTGFSYAIEKYPKRDVILLNSDIVAHPQWLDAMQHGAYEFDKKVGIVGAKLLYPDGRIQHGGTHRNTELPEWFDHYYRFQPSDYGPANVPQYCLGVTGACMYIKAATIKKLGILDEGFQFAFEDMDYCVRGWDVDIRTLYYPAATLTHVESATRSKNKEIGPKEKTSVRYFWEKWGDWFDNRNVKTKDGKTRIIYVLQSTGFSGGIKVVFEHLNRLQEQGYAAELWALDKAPTWMELKVPVRTFKNYQQMVKELQNEEAIKVATWWETAVPVWLSSVKKGIPAFIVQEIESSFYPNQPEIQKTVVSCYRKEFNNITSAEYTLDEIRALSLDAKLIPCGYDNTIFKPLPGAAHDKNTLIALGRSFFQKNFKQTFEAWKKLGEKSKENQPHMLLFGTEPQIAKWDKSIEYVTKPSEEEVNQLYNRATVFTQTSYHEGFCIPILEAMAAGCPVICTDSHGNRGFSHGGKNVVMVDVDDVDGLAKAIDEVISNPKLQERLRKAGLKTAQEYTWPTIIGKLDKHYQSLVAQPRRAYIKKVMKNYK